MNLSSDTKFCPQTPPSITIPYHATNEMQAATMVALILNCGLLPVGLAANILVFVTVTRKTALLTVYNTSILCLIASDLCVVLLAQTSNIAYLLNKFTTGDYSCSLFFVFNFFAWWCHGLSFFTLLVISIERYFAIFHPFKYKEIVTKTRIVCVVSICWIVWSVVVLVLNISPNIPHTVRTVVVTSFVLPSIIATVVIYGKIFRTIQGNIINVSPQGMESSVEDQDRKLYKTVGVIIGVQMLCFVPSLCLNVIDALSFLRKDLVTHGLFPFAESAAFLNALLDPVIYFWRNKEMRRSLGELWSKPWHRTIVQTNQAIMMRSRSSWLS